MTNATSPRRWTMLLAAVALASVALWLRPCGGDGRVARRGPELDAPTTTVAPSTTGDAPEKSKRRATPSDAPTPEDASSSPAAKTTVVVRVVAKDDAKPVAGADVLLDEENDGKDDVEHRAKTDATGVARFVDLPPCAASVRAWADDFVRSDFTCERAEAGEELTLDIALDRGVVLEGVVRDATSGRPIAGAVVDVVLGGSIEGIGSSGTSAPHLGLLTTGEDGRFRLRVPPDEMVTPTASARGFVATGHTVIVRTGDKPSPLVLRLEASGVLRGTVRAPNGAAVAGAKVYAVPADQRELLANPDGAVASVGPRWNTLVATTDAAGRYEIDGLARGGVYVAFAEAEGWARSAAIRRVLVTDASPAADADFALQRFGALRVHVVDADGMPCGQGYFMELRFADDRAWASEGKTHENGTAEFVRLRPGRLDVVLDPFHLSSVASVDVVADETAEITMTLEPGVSINGNVVDDLGAPVFGAVVDATREDAADDVRKESYDQRTTDGDGRFRLRWLREGSDIRHVLTASAEGHARVKRVDVHAPADGVRLVLPRSATATLRVIVPAGAIPPSVIRVRVEVPTKSSDRGVEAWNGGDGGGGPWELFPHGRVPIENVPPGPCRVRVMTREFAPLIRQVDAKPGETIDLGDATLDPGVDIAGRVEDAAGTPIVGARVTCGGDHAGDTWSIDVRKATTAADGLFRLEHLPTGPLDVAVAAPDFVRSTKRVDVAPGGGAVVVRLFRGALLTVTVVDAAGAPIPGASIVVRAANSSSDETTDRADHRGVAEFRVAPGKFRVAVEDKDAAAEVDLVEGGAASVRLVVK